MPQSGPLTGLRIADFSRVLAGPYATMLLGDLGADVVKVERPGTGDDTRAWGPPFGPDGASSYYLSVNRNKRSVVLDLTDEGDLRLARALATHADVLIHNFAPGKMEAWSLGYDDLSAANPGLVYVAITGFGPESDLPGYDFLVQAMSGLMSITGEPGSPTKAGVALVDVLTGLQAVIAVLAALEGRRRTGSGQRADVSLLGSALSALVNQASNYLTGSVVPEAMGNLHPSIAPYELFAAADGRFVVAVGTDGQFRDLCSELGLEELATDARYATNAARVTHRTSLHDALQAELATKSIDTWVARFRSIGIPCGPINDIPQAFDLAARLGLDPVVTTNGVGSVRSPVSLSTTPAEYRLPPPRLGEHDWEIRAALANDRWPAERE